MPFIHSPGFPVKSPLMADHLYVAGNTAHSRLAQVLDRRLGHTRERPQHASISFSDIRKNYREYIQSTTSNLSAGSPESTLLELINVPEVAAGQPEQRCNVWVRCQEYHWRVWSYDISLSPRLVFTLNAR